jgi:hypothetical protein
MVEDEDGEWARAVDVPSVESQVLEAMGYQELGLTCKDCDNYNRYNSKCELVPFLNLKVNSMAGRCGCFSGNIPAPAVVGGPDVDSTGRPWDKRIDGKSKSVNQFDGKWRPKRGVPREERTRVLAEYITPAVEND